MTQCTVAHQAPLSMGFSRQEFWSGFPCPPPGDLPNPGTEPMSLISPALAGRFFTISTTYELEILKGIYIYKYIYIALSSFFFFCKHLLAGKSSLQERALSKLPTALRVTAHCLQKSNSWTLVQGQGVFNQNAHNLGSLWA